MNKIQELIDDVQDEGAEIANDVDEANDAFQDASSDIDDIDGIGSDLARQIRGVTDSIEKIDLREIEDRVKDFTSKVVNRLETLQKELKTVFNPHESVHGLLMRHCGEPDAREFTHDEVRDVCLKICEHYGVLPKAQPVVTFDDHVKAAIKAAYDIVKTNNGTQCTTEGLVMLLEAVRVNARSMTDPAA